MTQQERTGAGATPIGTAKEIQCGVPRPGRNRGGGRFFLVALVVIVALVRCGQCPRGGDPTGATPREPAATNQCRPPSLQGSAASRPPSQSLRSEVTRI